MPGRERSDDGPAFPRTGSSLDPGPPMPGPASRTGRSQPHSKALRNPERAVDTVLVKAPAPVGATEVGASLRAGDLAHTLLRCDSLGGVDRVGVGDALDHVLGGDALPEIESHAELL